VTSPGAALLADVLHGLDGADMRPLVTHAGHRPPADGTRSAQTCQV
jgi:hypothetical protein